MSETTNKWSSWYDCNGSGGQGLIISEPDGRTIAVAYRLEDSPLIAAAPKMRSIIDKVLPMLEEHCKEVEGVREVIRALREVIIDVREKDYEQNIKRIEV